LWLSHKDVQIGMESTKVINSDFERNAPKSSSSNDYAISNGPNFAPRPQESV